MSKIPREHEGLSGGPVTGSGGWGSATLLRVSDREWGSHSQVTEGRGSGHTLHWEAAMGYPGKE